MKWDIPEQWQEPVNMAVITILLIGMATGFVALSALGFLFFKLSLYEDLPESMFDTKNS